LLKLGIFSKTFPKPTLAETLDAVSALGVDQVQLNAVPADLSPAACQKIHHEFQTRQLDLAILSGTFNIIHPDPLTRRQGFDRFAVLAASAKSLGTQILSVSTGTFDPEDMWRAHPRNETAEAWGNMLAAMAELATIAERQDVTIAFEPEQANIVDSAQKARALLDAFQSKHVKVLIDAANLLTLSNLPEQERTLRMAFDFLGEDIVAAHAKEFSANGTLGNAVLGSGVVDFALYTSLLRQLNRPISLIMHGFSEYDAKQSLAHMSFLQASNTVRQ